MFLFSGILQLKETYVSDTDTLDTHQYIKHLLPCDLFSFN